MGAGAGGNEIGRGRPSQLPASRALRQGTYSPDVDRFPLLVVACACACLAVGGKTLWDKYDNGDNLLFRESDLRDPSRLRPVQGIVEHRRTGEPRFDGVSGGGIDPWAGRFPTLHGLTNGNQVRPLSALEESYVTGLLGRAIVNRSPPASISIKPLSKANAVTPLTASSAQASGSSDSQWDFEEDDQSSPPAGRDRTFSTKIWFALLSLLVLCVGGGVGFWATRKGGRGSAVNMAGAEANANEPKRRDAMPEMVPDKRRANGTRAG